MKLSGNYLNIFLTYEIKFKLMHWREFADVQIKTVKTQKHLYCLVFTKIPTAFCRRDFLLVQAERFEKAVAKQRNSRWLFRRPCACRRARKRAERMNHLRHNVETKKISLAKSPNISGFFATQTAIFLCTKMQM